MADLTDPDLALIRDEVGDDEPTDDDLYELFEDLGTWRQVALRVLKRRRASSVGAAAGTLSSLTVPGAVSLGFTRSDIASLDRQIARLQAEVDAQSPDAADEYAPAASSRLYRRDRVR